MRPRLFSTEDLQAMKFGRLSVIGEAGKTILPGGQKIRVLQCKCDCGNLHNVPMVHLIRGRIQSCGCIQRVKKGESNTQLHRRWKAMIERCYMPNYINKLYQNKGITVCDIWKDDFFAFKKWALENGYHPDLTLDRINNSGNYEPGNCRWVTNKVNCSNRDVTFMVQYNSTKIPFTILIEQLGLCKHEAAIRTRIKRGWTAQRAFDTPIRQGKYRRKTIAQ